MTIEQIQWKKVTVTKCILAVNLLVFLLVELTGMSQDTEHMLQWGACFAPYVSGGEYYRLFTCMFLHFGISHLLNNMLVLYVIGEPLERVIGRIRFLIIYVIGGVGANIISMYLSGKKNSYPVSAGASGAIFALTGAMLLAVLANKGRAAGISLRQMVIMILFSVYLGATQRGVDNTAHVAGLVLGFILCTFVYLPFQSKMVQKKG